MRDITALTLLRLIPSHQDHPCQDNQRNKHSINDNMRQKAVQVSWSVRTLEDLRSDEISHRPTNKKECHSETFLSLTGCVAGDQGDDHVALGEEELRAVKGDEHSAGVGCSGCYDEDDDCSDDGWDGPELVFG